ncbi:hypothetical protein L0F63_007345 [Massospora cicadina]|nr:hypothetical protein L0F63_007345 [Massospora cicadina]
MVRLGWRFGIGSAWHKSKCGDCIRILNSENNKTSTARVIEFTDFKDDKPLVSASPALLKALDATSGSSIMYDINVDCKSDAKPYGILNTRTPLGVTMAKAKWRKGTEWIPLENRELSYNRIYQLPVDAKGNPIKKLKIQILDDIDNVLATFSFDADKSSHKSSVGDKSSQQSTPNPELTESIDNETQNPIEPEDSSSSEAFTGASPTMAATAAALLLLFTSVN